MTFCDALQLAYQTVTASLNEARPAIASGTLKTRGAVHSTMRRQNEAKIRHALPAALLFAPATFYACLHGIHLEQDGELTGWMRAAYRPAVLIFGLLMLIAYGTVWSNWRDGRRARSQEARNEADIHEGRTATRRKSRKLRFLVTLRTANGISPADARKDLLTRLNGEDAYLVDAEALQIQKVKRKRRVLRYVLLAAMIIFLVLWLITSTLPASTSDTFNTVADAL